MAICGCGIALASGFLLFLPLLLGGQFDFGAITYHAELPAGRGASGSEFSHFQLLPVLFAIFFFSLLGAIGGLVFWLAVVWGDRRLASPV